MSISNTGKKRFARSIPRTWRVALIAILQLRIKNESQIGIETP